MANNEDEIKIVFGAEADESSGEQTGKKLKKSVEKGFGNDGHIKVPVDITVPIDSTKKKLTEAQKDITSELSKMMAKGFSASGKDIDTLTSKFDKFAKALDSAGKGRQNKIFREIRKQVEELQKSYKALQDSQKASRPYETKVKKTDSSRKTKSSRRLTTEDEYYKQQEEYSKRAQGAGEKAEAKRDLKTYYKEGPYLKSSGNIDQTTFNEHEARLSRYSSYGSNWARELNKILKEETAKAIASLVTYIDKDYEIGKDNKLHGKKSGTPTTEAQMISAVYQKVKRDLTASIRQSEAGDESITVNTLTQLAAIMKVLNKTLMTELSGKSLEQAIFKTGEDIKKAINKPYDAEESDAIGFTDLKEGEQKGVGPGHENTKKIVAEFYDKLKSWDSEVFGNIKGSLSQLDETLKAVKSSDAYKAELNNLNSTMETVFGAVNDTVRETGNVNRSIKIGNTKEAVEDDAAEKISKEHKDIDRDTARTVKQDAVTGFNTDTKADELIQLVRNILQQLQKATSKGQKKQDSTTTDKTTDNAEKDMTTKSTSDKASADIKEKPDYSIEMKKAWDSLNESIDPIRAQMALIPVKGTFKNYHEGTDIVERQHRTNAIEKERKKQLEEASKSHSVEKSTIYASPFRQGFFNEVEDAFRSLTGTTKEYEKVLQANADKQDEMAATRIKTYGLNNGRNPNDTGDIAGMRRILQLYRTNKASIEQNPELMQKIKLTPGRDVDTTELTKELNKALSGKQMENAQNGGGFWKNFLGFATGGLGYAFMPSLEKSRAQADGLNQMMGNINKALQSVLINIQTKETELAGMEKSGEAKFDEKGFLKAGSSSAAFKTLADLEEEKLVLDSIKADLLANDEIIKKTGGRFSQIVKHLNFTSPVLKENNGILRNINSGLDKNGKALKFQTRMAEILNYTFQLMSRSIGQAFKNLLSMINPFNVIRNLFNDFSSYNVKWQRTMNVIKNNFREIILPFMDKIAQTLVNIIGFLDIISMKIQEAFGYTPISLFDQKNANDFKKTYEEIQNVTAGFDELHDIGSNPENDADNLLGEIYKPQLSQEWIDLANQIGDLFAGIIKGDLGFGDVMKKILDIAWDGLQILWDWFKNTEVGKWITENWDKILATMLTAFLTWKLLKVGGSVLVKALFGGLVSGAKTVFSTIGTSLASFMKMPNLSDLNLWGAMTSAEKFAVVLKGIVGISMTVASAIMGINTAYDSTHNEKELTETEKAFNSVKSVISDVGVGLGLFIATGNPAIALIGVLIEELVKTGVEFFTTKNAIGDATEELEEWQSACEEAEKAQESYREGMQQLREKEEEYGMSAENIYNLVESGKVKYEDLTAAQMDLYNSYVKVSELQDTSVQASQKATEEGLDREILKVKENQQTWEECYQKIEDAYQQGDISFAQYVDSCEELNSVLDSDSQRVFQENIPSYLEEAWNPNHYESSFQNLENAWGNICSYFEAHPLEALFDIVLSPIAKTIIGALAGFAVGGPLGAIIGGIGGAVWGVSSAINKSNSYVNDASTYTVGEEIDEDYLKKKGRFYDIGTNYVPNDGLAYLHQGEAVIPKKYNQPYQPSTMDQAYIDQMINTMRALDATIQQGIEVRGEFKQRGTDLVATVKRVENRNGNQPLNNSVFAR